MTEKTCGAPYYTIADKLVCTLPDDHPGTHHDEKKRLTWQHTGDPSAIPAAHRGATS